MFGDFMKRIISALLCILLIFLVCGCGGGAEKPNPEKDTPTVILPDETTKQTLNGYKSDITVEIDKTDDKSNLSAKYYANKSSKKFHLSSCAYAKKIKSENLYTINDRSTLIKDGYNPCAKCNP